MFTRLAERPWVVLFLASFLFLLQALPLFQTRWVEDDSWYSLPAYSFMQDGTLRNIAFPPADVRTLDSRPPLTTFVLVTSFKLFGIGPWQARLPSLLLALGTVWVTFFIGKELGGPLVGAAAALLVSCDTFLVLTARCTRPDADCTFFSMLAVLFYLYARRATSSGQEIGWAVGSGLSVGAAMMLHVNGLAGALGVGALIVIDYPATFWRKARAWAVVLAAFAAVSPCIYLLLTRADVMASFRAEYLSRTGIPLSFRASEEMDRFNGWIGLAKVPGLPFHFPVRLPVVAVILGSLIVVFFKNRKLFATMIALWIPNIAWFIYQDNKTLRFLVRFAPIAAILLAGAAVAWYRDAAKESDKGRRVGMLAAAVCVLFALFQLGGNMLLTYTYRHASYTVVSEQLRELIPPDQPVYGAITFWMSLHDRPYLAYNRTPFQYALDHRVTYWILNDRVMMHGEGEGKGDTWAWLRKTSNQYAQEHGELIGHVDNPFYGDLLVYRIHY